MKCIKWRGSLLLAAWLASSCAPYIVQDYPRRGTRFVLRGQGSYVIYVARGAPRILVVSEDAAKLEGVACVGVGGARTAAETTGGEQPTYRCCSNGARFAGVSLPQREHTYSVTVCVGDCDANGYPDTFQRIEVVGKDESAGVSPK